HLAELFILGSSPEALVLLRIKSMLSMPISNLEAATNGLHCFKFQNEESLRIDRNFAECYGNTTNAWKEPGNIALAIHYCLVAIEAFGHSPEGKIGMYTRFIEFANYRIPLSKFLLCVLEYYQIKLSQLSVIGAAKVSHFEIMCRALGRIPTMVCPLYTSWFSDTSVVKDPLSVDEVVDLPCVELLNENRTLIRKYPETFLCLVGLSRSFIETDVRPTLLHDNDEEIGLLDFVKFVDPFKVKVGERTLAENKVSLITENEDKRKKRVAFVSGSPPMKKAKTEGIVISDSRPSTAEDVTSSSVTPTSERVLEDALHDNVRTRPPSSRFVVLSSGSADTDIPATSQVVSLVSSSQASVSVLVTESAGDGRPLSAPELETETLSTTPSQGSSADDFYNPIICHSFLDHVTPLGYWAALRNQGYVGDAEVVELKAKLEKSESEAAEVEELRKRVSDLEAMVAVKVGEAASLTTQNASLERLFPPWNWNVMDAAERRFAERAAELDARIADLRRDMDNDLYPHMLTAIVGRRWVVWHDFRLAGLEAGVVHGKAGRSLTQIKAYDPEVEGKYVAAVSEFEGVSFHLLDDLESLKDSPLALIMSALILKDGQDREMLLSDAIPAIRQSAERRGLCPPSSSALGGTSGSVPSHDSSLGVMDYQVSTLVLSGDGGPTNPPPVAQPHDDLFDTSVLDKSGDV
ncbi:hypothetical protein Tco_0709439, partial [Tanacetum coccineum]